MNGDEPEWTRAPAHLPPVLLVGGSRRQVCVGCPVGGQGGDFGQTGACFPLSSAGQAAGSPPRQAALDGRVPTLCARPLVWVGAGRVLVYGLRRRDALLLLLLLLARRGARCGTDVAILAVAAASLRGCRRRRYNAGCVGDLVLPRGCHGVAPARGKGGKRSGAGDAGAGGAGAAYQPGKVDEQRFAMHRYRVVGVGRGAMGVAVRRGRDIGVRVRGGVRGGASVVGRGQTRVCSRGGGGNCHGGRRRQWPLRRQGERRTSSPGMRRRLVVFDLGRCPPMHCCRCPHGVWRRMWLTSGNVHRVAVRNALCPRATFSWGTASQPRLRPAAGTLDGHHHIATPRPRRRPPAMAPQAKQDRSFRALTPALSEWILEAVDSMGFVKTTPVQHAAIPMFMKNSDVVVEAVTGSGKTLS